MALWKWVMYVRALWCSVDKINRLFCLHKYYKAKYCRLEENCSLLGGSHKIWNVVYWRNRIFTFNVYKELLGSFIISIAIRIIRKFILKRKKLLEANEMACKIVIEFKVFCILSLVLYLFLSQKSQYIVRVIQWFVVTHYNWT